MPRPYDDEYVEYVSAKGDWLRRVAYLLCQDWHAADEITQLAVTRLYLKWPHVRRSDNMDAYARTVLVRVFLGQRRSPWSRVRLGDDQPQVAVRGADSATAVDVRRAVAALPARQRATVVLRYLCDLSVAETADALGCTQGTVKSTSARALAALRGVLADFAPLPTLDSMRTSGETSK